MHGFIDMKLSKFRPGKQISIFFIFFASLFFLLGLWQIERGQAKAKLIADFNNNLNQDPSYLSDTSKKWDRVFVDGVWDESKQILVDNSINRGAAGFKVLTPLKIKDDDRVILVDRGWIAQNIFRNELPDIDVQKNEISVSGILENPELGFVLSDNLVTSTWPKISQTKHLNVVSKEYNIDLEPFILVADPVLKDSLEYIKIIPTNMLPSKHYGYSAQWFTMFLVLCLMYIWLGFKKNEE